MSVISNPDSGGTPKLLEYKCPCCGGTVEFNPSAQKLKCPYCDTEFETEALLQFDEEIKSVQPDDMRWEKASSEEWLDDSLNSYICRSCGGEIIADENTAAAKCPFCDSPVVMGDKISGILKPDYVIPFKLDKNAAKEALKNHMNGKKLLPKVFKDENHIDEIKGIYVPFWIFGADAEANMQYRATRVRVWSDANYNYTETSHYSVIRGGNLSFERLPVDGSSKMPDDLMESIEPYDFSEAVDFSTAYLMGYLADKYDVSCEKSEERADERIKSTVAEELRSTVRGYATVVPAGGSVRLKNTEARYALYPVWLLNTVWQDKKYTFAMNGQTGKFVGDLPVDKGLYFKWLFGIAGAVGAAAFMLLCLLSLM